MCFSRRPVWPLLINLFINDIGEFIDESNNLLFAGDIKLFGLMNEIDDSFVLHRSLNIMYLGGEENFEELNSFKCTWYYGKVLLHKWHFSFSRLNYPGNRVCAGGMELEVGVHLIRKTTPDQHTNIISVAVCRSFRLLGLLLSYCSDVMLKCLVISWLSLLLGFTCSFKLAIFCWCYWLLLNSKSCYRLVGFPNIMFYDHSLCLCYYILLFLLHILH